MPTELGHQAKVPSSEHFSAAWNIRWAGKRERETISESEERPCPIEIIYCKIYLWSVYNKEGKEAGRKGKETLEGEKNEQSWKDSKVIETVKEEMDARMYVHVAGHMNGMNRLMWLPIDKLSRNMTIEDFALEHIFPRVFPIFPNLFPLACQRADGSSFSSLHCWE